MLSIYQTSAVDRGFEPRSSETKDYRIGISWLSAKHTALRRKGKYWMALNQDNGSEWRLDIFYDSISLLEQVNFQWNDDEVRFLLDQHAELDFYSASSLKQQFVDISVSPFLCIILESTIYRTRDEHADYYTNGSGRYVGHSGSSMIGI
jgi:hypothetical protein